MLHNESDRESRRNVNEIKISHLRNKLCKRKGASAHMEDKIISQILNSENMHQAKMKVVSNKGAAGTDGISVEEIDEYIKENWARIRQEIIERRYKPQPVLRVEIPKPNGGKRKLGIPTVMDRIIQQAIVQVLTPIIDKRFSETSYGFRPGRNCQMAITKSLEYLNDGFEWVVDIDLEKFFDKVPQDKLMSIVHEHIKAPDTESLIRKYLKAGIMNKGIYEKSEIGTPQGGNLSPLLSNIMLDKLDKELEARKLRYTRYADDCLIYVRSKAAATRVMHSITRFIEKKLGLKVNAKKSKITRPSGVKYLGFGYWKDNKANKWKARVHETSFKRFKDKIKKLTTRKWSVSLDYRIKKINEVTRGWINYFKIANMTSKIKRFSEQLRTRLRIICWKMWKVPKKRQWALRKMGITKDLAKLTAYCGNRYYFVATKTCLVRAITKERLSKTGLIDPYDYYISRSCVN